MVNLLINVHHVLMAIAMLMIAKYNVHLKNLFSLIIKDVLNSVRLSNHYISKGHVLRIQVIHFHYI